MKGTYGTDYAHDPELAALGEPARFARSVDTALDPVTPALWGLEGTNTYLPSASRRVADLTPTDVGVRERPSSGVELSRFAAAGPSNPAAD